MYNKNMFMYQSDVILITLSHLKKLFRKKKKSKIYWIHGMFVLSATLIWLKP